MMIFNFKIPRYFSCNRTQLLCYRCQPIMKTDKPREVEDQHLQQIFQALFSFHLIYPQLCYKRTTNPVHQLYCQRLDKDILITSLWFNKNNIISTTIYHNFIPNKCKLYGIISLDVITTQKQLILHNLMGYDHNTLCHLHHLHYKFVKFRVVLTTSLT